MDAIEFAGLASSLAETGEDRERLAVEDTHFVVLSIGQVDEFLLRIAGEGDVPGRAGAERAGFKKRFLDECAVGLEHLNSIVDAIAHIEQTVIGKLGAVDGIAKLLGWRLVRLVGTGVRVVRLLAVGAPMTFISTCIGVRSDDAMVAIAIGDVKFVGLRIDN